MLKILSFVFYFKKKVTIKIVLVNATDNSNNNNIKEDQTKRYRKYSDIYYIIIFASQINVTYTHIDHNLKTIL